MTTKREEQSLGQSFGEAIPVVAVETLRRAAAPPPALPKGEEHLPVFWRIFGTTVLSIAALVALTLYQQLSAGLGELRTECRSLSDACGDLIKKDDYNSRNLAVANSIKEVQANNAAALDLWRERALLLDRQIKVDAEEYKQQARDLTKELQRLRERLAVVESRQPPANLSGAALNAKP